MKSFLTKLAIPFVVFFSLLMIQWKLFRFRKTQKRVIKKEAQLIILYPQLIAKKIQKSELDSTLAQLESAKTKNNIEILKLKVTRVKSIKLFKSTFNISR